MKNELVKIVDASGLQPTESKLLLESFGDLFVQAHKLKVAADSIKVTNVEQVEEMEKSRELRLQLREVRIEANKTRIHLKEGYMRGANAIQRIFNDIKDITKPVEEKLLKQEKFAERLKTQELINIELSRSSELSKYVADISVFKLHPTELSNESFTKLLTSSKLAFDAQQLANRKAQNERDAKVKADLKKQEEIRKENIKLKKDAEIREKKIADEQKKRDAAEKKKLDEQKRLQDIADKKAAKLKAENEAKLKAERADARKKQDKLEAELEKQRVEKAKKEQEEKMRREAKEEADRKAILAPDKEKLILLSNQILDIMMPAVASAEAGKIIKIASKRLSDASAYLIESAQKL